MPIKTYKVAAGGGLLSIGEAGTAIDATAQVQEAAVEFSEEVEDAVPVLSGEELEGEATYPAKLTVTMFQDLTPSGINRWSFANRGKVLPFQFTPSDNEGMTVSGNLRVAPLNIGGKAKDRASADVEFTIIGDPVLGDDL